MKKKLMELFEAARNSLKEALKSTTPEETKTKLVEADKAMDVFVQEASAMADDETEEAKAKREADEKKKAEEAKESARRAELAAAEAGKETDEAKESRKLAIKGLLAEAGLSDNADVVKSVEALSLKEAKTQIEFLKKFKEATVMKAVKTMGVPASQFEKLSESDRKEHSSANNGKFAGCSR